MNNKEERLQKQLRQTILAFRRIKDYFGRLDDMSSVMSSQRDEVTQRKKQALNHALFELQDAYGDVYGWADTNPMCNKESP